MENAQTHIEGLLAQGKLAEAAESCQVAILRHPTNARFHAYLGMSLFRTEQFAPAESSFRRATLLDPKFWEAGVKHAQCLYQLRNFEEAYKVAMEWAKVRPADNTLRGLIEFLKPLIQGERQGWERTVNLERKIVMHQE